MTGSRSWTVGNSQTGVAAAMALLLPLLFTTTAARGESPPRQRLIAAVKKRIGVTKNVEVYPFFGDYGGDGRDDALVFAYFPNRNGGNSNEIRVLLYEGTATGFNYVRTVPEVYGIDPRDARFSRGQIKVTLTTLGPNDPRCCPTATQVYTITR